MTLPLQETKETDELKLKGAMLVKVRGMTPEERLGEGWQNHPEDIPCIEYDTGAVLYPACERCDKPGTFYGTYESVRWGIDSAGEPYERPPGRKVTPRWFYPAVAFAVLLTALAAAGVVTLFRVNQDQRDQVHQQQQIIREQRAMMSRQMDNQRTIERLIRGNKTDVKQALDDIKGQVSGVVAERDGLRAANAQLSQDNAQLKKRAGGGRR